MARPKSPDGRSETRAAKFSEAEIAAIDVVRGDVRWSEWMRALVLAAIEPGQVRPAVTSEPVNQNEPVNLNPVAVNPNPAGKPVNRNVEVNLNKAPSARAPKPAAPSVGPVADAMAALERKPAERCPHPKARVLKGKCWACGEAVSKR